MPFSPFKAKPKRSPIRTPPLPQAGDSLGRRIDQIIEDWRMVPATLAMLAIGLVIMEWARWLWNLPPYPKLATAIAVVLVGVAIFTFYWTRPALRNLKLGREGEQTVGQELERLHALEYEVFHDVIDKSKECNIDHVLIGPGGIFTIETKTWSKCGPGNVTIEDGEVRVNGIPIERDCLAQARAQASSLRGLIHSLTGGTFFVQPVLVFPGWFVVPPTQPSDVWVLNPKVLKLSLKQAGRRLSQKQIRWIADKLTEHVRGGRPLGPNPLL